jgi:hypothetical protein
MLDASASRRWLAECWDLVSSCFSPAVVLRRASDILEGYPLNRASGSLPISLEPSPARPARAKSKWFSGLDYLVDEEVEAPAATRAMPVLQSVSLVVEEVPRLARKVSFDLPGDVAVLPERRSRFTFPSPPENRMRRSVSMGVGSLSSDSGISDGAEAVTPVVHAPELLGRASVLCAINGVAVRHKPPPVVRDESNSQGDAENHDEYNVVVAVAMR